MISKFNSQFPQFQFSNFRIQFPISEIPIFTFIYLSLLLLLLLLLLFYLFLKTPFSNNFRDSNFQISFRNPVFSRTVLISLRFSNNLLFLLILHKRVCNFHNSRIMELWDEFMQDRSGFGGDPTYEFSFLIVNCYA